MIQSMYISANLHSTMLLLYLTPDILCSGDPIFTFHYASTLSCTTSPGRKTRSPFTFHYASTLSFIVGPRVNMQRQFTFHYASTLSHTYWQRCLTCRSYLHSTMLLLYPKPVLLGHMPYATFTFHYASTLSWQLRKRNARSCIYIPLCFYFIKDAQIVTIWLYLHLHSTMLLLYHVLRLSVMPFCYIYIPLCFYFITSRISRTIWRGMNLHSTMLLLYRWCVLYNLPDFLIYIPLCFYFIENARKVKIKYTYLHSTMLLLYHTLALYHLCTGLIYIPLCFYFID